MEPRFDAYVRSQPGSAVIDRQGEIDGFAEVGLNQAYAEAERLNQPNIVLNFQRSQP